MSNTDTTFNQSHSAGNLPTMVDFSKHIDSLPVVTLQAFNIQGLFNICVASVQARQTGMPLIPGADEEEIEEQIHDCIFSLGEMLKMAIHLDYSDESGRRKMFSLIRKHAQFLY